MNKFSRYRWYWSITGFFCGIIILQILVVNPWMNHLKSLKIKENKLAKIYANEKVMRNSSHSENTKLLSETDLISQLTACANTSNLLIKKMQIRQNILHLTFQTNFHQFLNFLYQAQILNLPIIDYQLTTSGEGQLDLSTQPFSEKIEYFKMHTDIPTSFFCRNQRPTLSVGKRFAYPVSSIRMSGFISLNNQIFVLLSLPNGELINAAINDLIGKEHAKIISIAQGLTILEMPDKKRFSFRMSLDEK